MILGIGVDIVEVRRVARMLAGARAQRTVSRIFTAAEARRCHEGGRAPESFAARFAAKEALFKALGTGWGRGGRWTEVEVVTGAGGAPTLRLSGAAARAAEARGVRALHLSLTHTAETAAAFVVVEGGLH